MRLATIALALSLTSPALADIAPLRLVGGTSIQRMKPVETKVSMKHEVIRLKLSPESCSVNVVFTMRNDGDKPESIVVGFPVNYKGELVDFRAKVNNKAVGTSDRTTSYEVTIGTREIYWKSWQMQFPPQKDTKVEVSYSTRFHADSGRNSGSLNLQNGFRRRVVVSLAPEGTKLSEKELAELTEKLHYRKFCYTLRTGASWHKEIGTCRVELTCDGLSTDHLAASYFRPQPTTSVKKKNTLTYEWKNLEPKHDLCFRLTPKSTQQEREAIFGNLYERFPESTQVAIVLANYRELRGARSEAAKIQRKLLETWLDRIEIWGPEKRDSMMLAQSMMVWRIAVALTGGRELFVENGEGRITESSEPAVVAPLIARLVDRVESQMKYADSKSPSADYFRGQIKEMRKWCGEHSKKAAVP